MNKKVLLFTAYFPPRRRVGALRPFRFAKYLKAKGWDVHVIHISDINADLTRDEKKDLEGIQQFRIEPPFDQTSKKKSSAGSSKKNKPLSDFIDRNFPIDTWLPLFWKHKKEIFEYVNRIQPDIMWSSSDPWSVNHTARKISNHFDIPWVADFRDPWTLCAVRYGHRNRLLSSIDKNSEKGILQDADHITFTAATTLNKYAASYPYIKDKSSVILNAFDHVGEVSGSDSVSLPGLDKNQLNILFLGKFRPLSNAESILKVLGNFKSKYPDRTQDIRIYSMGELKGSDLNEAKRLDVLNLFEKIERVPHAQVPALIEHFDLNLLSTHPDRDDIIPAKLYDYLPSGNPIFSLAPNQEVGEIIEDTGTGTHFGINAVKDATDHLNHLLKLKKEGNLSALKGSMNKEALTKYTADPAGDRLEDIFNQILSDGK